MLGRATWLRSDCKAVQPGLRTPVEFAPNWTSNINVGHAENGDEFR